MPGMDILSLLLSTLLFLSLNLSSFATAGDGQFLYSGFTGSNLTVDGEARVVTPQGLLQLSSSIQAVGHAIHPTPLQFRKLPYAAVQSFSVSFVFCIISDYSDYSPHGITFFVARSNNFSTATGSEFLGLLNEQNNGNASNHIFAVELDTMQNAELQDINDNHVGININSLVSVESRTAGYYDDDWNGNFHNLTMSSREAMQVWVEYDEDTTQINVTLAPLYKPKPVKPLISTSWNLSTVLTEVAYVGFSSTTEPDITRHYILGWSFGMNRPAPAIPIAQLPQLPQLPRKDVVMAAGNGDYFVFSGFTGANLTLNGTATVTSDGLLELTNGTVQLNGHAIFPVPLHFRSGSSAVWSFSSSFAFGILINYHDMIREYGALAFIVAPNKDFSSIWDYTNGSNHIFSVELNDNNIWFNMNNNSNQWKLVGYYDDNSNFQSMNLISGEVMQVWVDYDGEVAQINFTIAPIKMSKPVMPLFSTSYNLSDVLTELAYVGFSSQTTRVTTRSIPIDSRHYIFGWSFGMNAPAPAIDIAKLSKMPRLGPKPQSKVLEILLPIATASFILAIGTFVVHRVRRRLRYAELREDWEVEFGPHRFSYKDLFHATEGFKSRHLLGKGGFGSVYKGVLPESKLEIAVKRVSHDSKQGLREFIAEVISIGRLRHQNIMQLLGYCRRKSELLLVYDYMPNGSLDKYLYCSGGERPSLDWVQRFRIIKGVASGLRYLHREWEQVVIHRDVKASNVLLDEAMNGRLGDFGLARLYDHGTDMQITHLAGTIGYLAPELVRTGKASPSTDVFAFGIFALEATCGRKPINHKMHSNQLMLVDWVLGLWRDGSIAEAMDPSLQNDGYDVDDVCLVLKLGLLCSHPSAAARPSMWHVMQYLNHDLPFPELQPIDMVQIERIDSLVAYYQSSMASNATMSGLSLSGGR